MEYVEFIENPTKTRQSGLSAKPRSCLPKMFATGDERCPVAIFKEFLWHRPPELRTTGPLYLSCVPSPSSQVWYKRQPMGENKINSMMKSVIEGTTLEDSSKTFSNHSARESVLKKLKTAGLERASIVKVTGHRNEKSLDDYDEGDEKEQRQQRKKHQQPAVSSSKLQFNVGKPVLLRCSMRQRRLQPSSFRRFSE